MKSNGFYDGEMKSLSFTIFRDRYHQEMGTCCDPRKAEKLQISHPAPLLQTSLEGNKDLTQLRGRLYPSPQSNCVESANSHEAAMTCLVTGNSVQVLCSPTLLPLSLQLISCRPCADHFLQRCAVSNAVAS